MFCDASQIARSVAAYLRFTKTDGTAHISLIMAKSRIAPIKKVLTIPRLELQAALLAARLAEYLTEELNMEISRRVYWSDSKTLQEKCICRSSIRRNRETYRSLTVALGRRRTTRHSY